MTLIVHRCQVCQHMDLHHNDPQECSVGHCRERRHTFTPGPSEAVMTYAANGRVATSVTAPGTTFAAFGAGPAITTCECPSCWALYRQVTGAPDPP
ncbi:MAG TPA: hypothetical protein VFW65_31890 [Pseudonocardiaceae bacterium]|nr:hypothetical protein [Pseudonocardiaceae bacterium]